MKVDSSNILILGTVSEKSSIFKYERDDKIYHFSCENKSDFEDWNNVLTEGRASSIRTAAIEMLNAKEEASIVMLNNSKRGILILKSGTIYCYESAADAESLFEFYIHESKILTVEKTREFTFVHLNNRKTVKFQSQAEFDKWKNGFLFYMFFIDFFCKKNYNRRI